MNFRTLRSLLNLRLCAKDGEMGRVCDFYFDDREWKVRYLVDDTGRFFHGKKVLISPAALSRVPADRRAVYADLTLEQVRRSPGVETHKPVSIQEEERITHYFNWPVYWSSFGEFAGAIPPIPAGFEELPRDRDLQRKKSGEGEDSHLRSFREVCGYALEASDGPIGHLDDLIVDLEDWTLRYLVAEVAFFPRKESVVLAPSWAREIRWSDAKIRVDVSRAKIVSAPRFDAHEPVNREHELRLYDYYGRPYYWK